MRIERFEASIGIDRLNKEISGLSDVDFLHVRHVYPEFENWNMISLSRRVGEFRETLRLIAGKGLHLYKLENSTSSFVGVNKLRDIWTAVESGAMQYDENNVPYTWTAAPIRKREKLLVIFSSIANQPHQSSLKRHFEQNFATLGKYIPQNTSILRIADLGGVNGGWYLNTNYLTNNFANVQALIRRQCSTHGIDIADTVFYGASKGGTAALLHGMAMGAKVVAVDPIISDRLYVEQYDDLHFTVGNFPKTKDQLFEEVKASYRPTNAGAITVLYSDMSPQFAFINERLRPWTMNSISYINVSHPEIKDHPDVGPRSMSTTVMLINMKLHNLAVPVVTMDEPFGGKSPTTV